MARDNVKELSQSDRTIRYQASREFVLREVAGEMLLVPTGSMAHKLNAAIIFSESAALLWKQLIKTPLMESEMADILVKEYDISKATAAKDVSSFLEKAVENGMISQVSN